MSLTNLSEAGQYPTVRDDVIARAMRGDKSALGLIYDAYARRIYRYLYSRVRNVMDAEDLLTQTFMRVLEALPGYQHRRQFTAWIFQIARNQVIDHFRRGRKVSLLKEDVADRSRINDFLENVIQHQDTQRLDESLESLKEEELEMLRLRFVAELSYVEIAALLGRKEDAVRKSVQRTLDRLYAEMEMKHA